MQVGLAEGNIDESKLILIGELLRKIAALHFG